MTNCFSLHGTFFQMAKSSALFMSVAVAALCFTDITSSKAALAASDSASTYNSWNSGDNQGSGFGAWSFANSGGGSHGEYLGVYHGGSSVDSGNGKVWGIYANNASDAQANAIRPFTGGSLAAGQTLSFQMNNGGVGNNVSLGGSVGVSLRDSSHNNIFEFYFHGGDSDYTIKVGGATTTTTIGWTTSALNLAFTQGSGTSWSLSINGSTTYTSSGTGNYLSSASISEMRFFSYGDNNDIFVNNLDITPVPEPITLALPIFGGLVLTAGVARRFVSRQAKPRI